MNTSAQQERLSGLVYCVDLAKNVFEVHTFDRHGHCTKSERLRREKFAAKFTNAQTRRGVVVMEACGSSNYWGRRFTALGHSVVLVPAQFVARRRVGNKNDGNDADAIHAVYTDPRIKPVPVKTLAQQDVTALHCVRELLTTQHTQCINQIRGLLAERGVVESKGQGGLQTLLKRINQDNIPEVTPTLQHQIAIVSEHMGQIEAHLKLIEQELALALKHSHVAQQVKTIFGVGLVTATAFAGEYGAGVGRFHDGRQFAANIGITPSEHSSGEKRRHGRITKRGNPYLRKLLVQCANVIVNQSNRRDDELCLLARRLFAQGKRRSAVIVAVANHLARIIYSVIKHGEDYQPNGRRALAQAA